MLDNASKLGLFGFGSLLTARRVTMIRKPGNDDRYEHITDLAGPGWGPLTVAEVISDMRQGRPYFTSEDGTTAVLQIEQGFFGRLYVRTHPDCTRANNLLSLRRFM